MAEEEKSTKTPKETPEKAPEKTEKKKSKVGLIIGTLIGLVVVIAAVVVAVVLNNKKDPSDPTASLSYSKSFFIYDNGSYTLWNAEGKRVTEDTYSSQSTFVGGYAYVKKDDQYGVIKEDGSASIDFGKYGAITVQGGLYLAQDGNTKEYYLLTGSGKELEHNKTIKPYTANSYAGFAAVKVDEKIKLYNYEGKLMAEVDLDDSASDPVLTYSNDFGSFSYNQKNYVFDARDGRILAEYEGSRYIFSEVSEDRSKILMRNNDDSSKYKLIADNKTYDLDETKHYAIADRGIVIGYDNYNEIALLDNDYKVARRVNAYLQLKDVNNFATDNKSGNAEIYNGGEMVKDLGEDSGIRLSGVLYDNYYAISTGENKAKFFNLNGSEAFDGHEYYDIATMFDEHHHALVADEKNSYYLIDTSGHRINDITVKGATSRDGGYELKNSDDKLAIANKEGELQTEFKYDNTYDRNSAKPNNIWTGRIKTGEYDVVNVDAGKIILSSANVQSFYANYFTVKNSDKKTEYYTYKGELFYTSEK